MTWDIIVKDSLFHFLSSAFVGFLAFSLTWTTWRFLLNKSLRSYRGEYLRTRADRLISLASLSAGLLGSWLTHLFFDYYVNIWG